MKKIIITYLLFGIIFSIKSQSKIEKDSSKLVSEYAFRRLIQKDFRTIVFGNNGFSNVGHYATLDINKDESTFYLSPIVFENNQNPLNGPFKTIHSIDISGKVNGQNIFDFENKKIISLAYSFTKIFENYTIKNQYTREYILNTSNKIYNRFKDCAKIKLSNYCDSLKYSGKNIDLKILEEIANFEEAWAADKWDKKKIGWLKFNLNALSFDNFKIVDKSNLSTLSEPLRKSIYAPSAAFSYNHLTTYMGNENQFFWNVWLKISQKHSLSEFSSTQEWSNFSRLTDSTIINQDRADVYLIKEADISIKPKIDIGSQLTYLFNISKIRLGINVSGFYKQIVSNVNEKANAFEANLGLIIPLKDKEGNYSININPFYSSTNFNNYSLPNKNTWGVKFGLPFSSIL